MISPGELIKYELEPVPEYLIKRDLLRVKQPSQEMDRLKSRILETKWVRELVQAQWQDGSWGRFHSLDSSSKASTTTETALRRLLVLGLDRQDEPIQRALAYMKQYLNREIALRDRREKKHDWELLTNLFVATWVLRIDPAEEAAGRIARQWAQVVSHAFAGEGYDHRAYQEAYGEILKPEKGKTLWGFQNYYLVALLPGLLDPAIESKFLDYLLGAEQSIYYIYDKNLNQPPADFCSRRAHYYLTACELLSRYPGAAGKMQPVIDWTRTHLSADGFWDMGQIVQDKREFPLSDSWRKPLNRKIDCTVRIQRILSQIGQVPAISREKQ